MTKDSLMKMEMGKKFKVALTIPLVDIMKLSLSPDAGNQVVIIQLRGMLCRVWVFFWFELGSGSGWVWVGILSCVGSGQAGFGWIGSGLGLPLLFPYSVVSFKRTGSLNYFEVFAPP